MHIQRFSVNPFAENTYVLLEGSEAVVIDPGFLYPAEYEKFYNLLSSNNVSLKAIILTHAHIDHILGVQTIHNRYDVPAFLHDDDRYFWDNFQTQASMFGLEVNPFTFEPESLRASKNWEIGNFILEVRHTPGHAPGHVIFYIEDEKTLIGGDTVFLESIGRTDLYKGNYQILEKSIREQIYTLPDDTKILPGHGPETTVGHEKKYNPFVKS
jgi:glyoxylase-like metal-dependent hydrolase (beta-lactamase superfamily II)